MSRDGSGLAARLPELRTRAIAGLGGAALTALLHSARYRVLGYENYAPFAHSGEPVIFVLWHGRLLPCTFVRRGEGIAALISRHRDGEYIARIAEGWGYEAVRGSSSRGGMGALRELVRKLREGRSIAITPDGPRGPREQMKPGALTVAQMTGAPIVPVAAGADRAWWFGSWDRFLVPKPLARVNIVYGAPVRIPRDMDAVLLTEWTRIVGERLREVTRQADAG